MADINKIINQVVAEILDGERQPTDIGTAVQQALADAGYVIVSRDVYEANLRPRR